MYYSNVYFHNVRDMIKTENGYALSRFPKDFFATVYNPIAKLSAERATGVELRFKPVSDTVTLKLCLANNETSAYADVYYGTEFMPNLSVLLTNEPTEIAIPKPSLSQRGNGVFCNNVVRILLPNRKVEFISIEGDAEYPYPNEMPKTAIYYVGANRFCEDLFNHPSTSIPTIVSERMGVDTYNLSFEESGEYYSLLTKHIEFTSGVVVSEILTKTLIKEDLKSVKSTAKKVRKTLNKIPLTKIYIDGLNGYEENVKPKQIAKIDKKLKKPFKKKLLFKGLNYFSDKSTPATITEIAYELVRDFIDYYDVFNPKTTFKRGKAISYKYAPSSPNEEPISKPKVAVK